MKKSLPPRSWNATGEVLRTLVPQFVQSHRWHEYRVWEIWEDVVGETLARKARPTKIHNGKLFVTVSNSILMQELQFAKATVRDRLNAKLGTPVVRDLLFVIGRVRDQEGRPLPPVQRPLPRFTQLRMPSLNNPELETAFLKLLEARQRRLLQKGGRRG
jgi:predicted nucleic acid-binding Zn ribbon protein